MIEAAGSSSAGDSGWSKVASGGQADPRDEERFRRLMSGDATGSQGSADTPAAAAANEAALWDAYYQGLTDWILRSGIRRSQNFIADMKRIYREDF